MKLDVRLNLYVKHEILPKMKRLGFTLSNARLNIVAVRTPFTEPDIFDDWIFTFGMFNGKPTACHAWRCTTDPGTKPLENPWKEVGTAIVAEQQVLDAYQIDSHKGYPALRQRLALKVWRDNNKDNVPDTGRAWEHGIFLTNIHASDKDPFRHPRAWSRERVVGGWSAGCIVFADSYEYACEWWPTILRAEQAHFHFTLLELPDPGWSL